MSGQSARLGFTLAEVLITLGIIGIVAAITLTTFINDIQDKQLTAMWKKKYSEISNIYTLVKEEIGGDFCIENKSDNFSQLVKCKKINQWVPPYTYTTLSPEFVNKFVSHLNIIDSCGKAEYNDTKKCENFYVRWVGLCGNGVASYYGSLAVNHGSERYKNPAACSQTSLSGMDFSKKAVLLADGTVIYFGGYATGIISVDVNGFEKGPNVVGRDVFAVMVNEDWAKPLGAEGTFNTSANGKTCECSKNYGVESAQGFLGSSNLLDGRMLSGTCCSATKLGL